MLGKQKQKKNKQNKKTKQNKTKQTNKNKQTNKTKQNKQRTFLLLHSVEFQAWDIHSGLKSIQWRLYDNYTNPDTTHGSGALPVDDSVVYIFALLCFPFVFVKNMLEGGVIYY